MDRHLHFISEKWSWLFWGMYSTLLLLGGAVTIYLFTFGRYAFLPIAISGVVSLLGYPFITFKGGTSITANIKILYTLQFISLAAFLMNTHLSGFSFLSYGFLSMSALLCAGIALQEDISSFIRIVPVLLLSVWIVIAMQIQYPGGLVGPDARGSGIMRVVEIVQTSHLKAQSAESLFPVYYVFLAQFKILSDIGGLWSYIIGSSSVMIGGIIVSYSIIIRIFNEKIGAVSALIIAIADYSHLTLTKPGVLTFSYPIILVSILLIMMGNKKKEMVCIPVLFLALVLVHPFSTALATVVLVFMAIIEMERRYIYAALTLFVGFWGYVFTIAHPMWSGFVGTAILDLYQTFFVSSSSLTSAGRYSSVSVFNLLFNTAGQALLLGTAILGGLYLTEDLDRFARYKTITGLSGFLIGIALFGTVFGISFLLPQRWYLLAYFIGVNALAAVALVKLGRRRFAVVVIAALALLAPMSAIAGFSTAPFYDRPYTKSYGTAEEVVIEPWVQSYAPNAIGPYGYTASASTDIYQQNGAINPDRVPKNSIVLFDDEYKDTGAPVSGTGMKIGSLNYVIPSDNRLYVCDQIYESGPIRGYTNC